jgi:hypothetical protein
MHMARILLITALAAIAAMALTATAAIAENQTVQIEEENEEASDGDVCTDALNNCVIHAVGIGPESGGTETQLIRHPLGVVSICEEEFEGEIFNEAGTGHFYFQEIHDGPSAQCNVRTCDESSEREWPFTVHEEGGEFWLQIEMCVHSAALGGDIHCHLEPEIQEVGTHHYVIHANNMPCQNEEILEVNGRWELETHPHSTAAHDDIEIGHTTLSK